MSILIIGLTLVLANWLGRRWRRLRQRTVNLWFGQCGSFLRGRRFTGGALGVVLLVSLPPLLVGAVQYLLTVHSMQLSWFLLSLLVVLFSWGPRDLDQDVANYLEAENEPARSILAEPLIFSYRNPHHDEGTKGVIKGVFYQGLVRWFGVIFWFLVLGAAGALLFRLAHALLCESRNRALISEAQAGIARWLVGLLDVVPAVLMTAALAIVGDFDAVTSGWRAHRRQRKGGPWEWDYELLPRVGYRAVIRDEAAEQAFSQDYEGALARVSQAMSLVWRALACWMTLLALMIIAGLAR